MSATVPVQTGLKLSQTKLKVSLTRMALILCLLLNGATYAEQKSYRIGVVPQLDARQLLAIWQPILNELEKKTQLKFTLTTSPSIPDFENLFGQGTFDFAYMNPYHLLIANKEQGYIPLVRETGKQLHGVLVVKKGSGISTIEQLQGKSVSFPAPNALGASLMIRAELKNIYNVEIIPRYVLSHTSVYLNTALGLTNAGGGVEKTLSQQPDNIKDSLLVLLKTQGVAPHPITVHPRVPIEVREKVKLALLEMGSEKHGKELLAKVPIKQIGPATLEDYLSLRKLNLEEFFVKE
jgi:phosphonate transport system substrate-binding protein